MHELNASSMSESLATGLTLEWKNLQSYSLRLKINKFLNLF